MSAGRIGLLEDGEPLPFNDPQAVRSCVELDSVAPSTDTGLVSKYPRLHHLPKGYRFYRSGDDGQLHFNAAIRTTGDRTLLWHNMLANILTEAAAVSTMSLLK